MLNQDLIPAVVLYGAGGFALEIAEYAAEISRQGTPFRLAGVVDDFPKNRQEIPNVPFLGPLEMAIERGFRKFIITAGSPHFRKQLFQRLKQYDCTAATLIHPSAIISPTATIGEGSLICPFSIINSGATIGINSAINVHCSVGHGASIGDHCTLSPYSALNGDSKIGEGTFLGTHATIFPKVAIGRWCTVDTHTFVKRDAADSMIISARIVPTIIQDRLKKEI
jgi:sugar O-acyltransferase (sialic acid O-acetyltransferase NeuD family)